MGEMFNDDEYLARQLREARALCASAHPLVRDLVEAAGAFAAATYAVSARLSRQEAWGATNPGTPNDLAVLTYVDFILRDPVKAVAGLRDDVAGEAGKRAAAARLDT